jgi:multicomponent Na+:H+ antiporter subunit F
MERISESVVWYSLDGVAGFLLLVIAMGLWRVIKGPTRTDRMLSAQLMGTVGVALVLVLAERWQAPAWRDVALVLALLSAVTGLAFVRLVGSRPSAKDENRIGESNG